MRKKFLGCALATALSVLGLVAVSYTHLDVYKRQVLLQLKHL